MSELLNTGWIAAIPKRGNDQRKENKLPPIGIRYVCVSGTIIIGDKQFQSTNGMLLFMQNDVRKQGIPLPDGEELAYATADMFLDKAATYFTEVDKLWAFVGQTF